MSFIQLLLGGSNSVLALFPWPLQVVESPFAFSLSGLLPPPQAIIGWFGLFLPFSL